MQLPACEFYYYFTHFHIYKYNFQNIFSYNLKYFKNFKNQFHNDLAGII